MTEVAESIRRLSAYVRSLPTDVQTRYLAKTAALNCDPYCVREVQFSSDATTWPPVEHVDVINYTTLHAISLHERSVKEIQVPGSIQVLPGWLDQEDPTQEV